jgi:hypothetical protein
VNHPEIIRNSIQANLERLGVDAYNQSLYGLQSIAPAIPVTENQIVPIELYDDILCATYNGKLLANILAGIETASLNSPSTSWIWKVIDRALI